MDNSTLLHLLSDIRSIAVVGAKDVPGQAVDTVGRYLIKAGYDIIPVHPVRKNIWGLSTYPSLTSIGRQVDMVNVFRASHLCLEHARESLALSPRPRLFWMQLGISNEEAAGLLTEHGVIVIENACLMVEHALLVQRH
jgi:predicted CoA-binding protein